MVDIWQETHTLAFRDIDNSDRMTLASAFDYFQEAAINHAENLAVGREAMARTGQIWALSRMSVLVETRPLWKDKIRIRTWPRGGEKLFALRDYDISIEDAPMIRGRSGWLILDMEKRRPLRVQGIMETMPLNENTNALSGIPASLEARESLALTGERRASYSDIDYNGHVNNVRYVQWIQDAMEADLLEHSGGMRLDINYLREVRLGEIIQLWTAPLDMPNAPGSSRESATDPGEGWDAGIAIEGRQEDGQGVFRAELRIQRDAKTVL